MSIRKCLLLSPLLAVFRVTTLTTYLSSCLSLSSDSHDLWFLLSSFSLLCWRCALNDMFHFCYCFLFFFFSVRYFLLRFLYVTFNFVFVMPVLIFSSSLQQNLIFLIFYLFHVYSLYVVMFLISSYKTAFTISSLCLLSCGTKVWALNLVHLLALRAIKCDCPTVGLACLIKLDTSACYAIPSSCAVCRIRSSV